MLKMINTEEEYKKALIEANSFLNRLESAFDKHKEEDFLRQQSMDFIVYGPKGWADYYVTFNVSDTLELTFVPDFMCGVGFMISNVAGYIKTENRSFTRKGKCIKYILDYFEFLFSCNEDSYTKSYRPKSLKDELIEICNS